MLPVVCVVGARVKLKVSVVPELILVFVLLALKATPEPDGSCCSVAVSVKLYSPVWRG